MYLFIVLFLLRVALDEKKEHHQSYKNGKMIDSVGKFTTMLTEFKTARGIAKCIMMYITVVLYNHYINYAGCPGTVI